MVEFLLNLADFGVRVGLVAIATGIVIAFLASFFRKGPGMELGQMTVIDLNAHHEEMQQMVKRAVTDAKAFKEEEKQAKKDKKEDKDKDKDKRRVFVLDFHGDIAATAVAELREQITVLLDVMIEGDEVVVNVESGGGLMHDYGLAAAQLVRLRDAGFKLTICVDKIAASGGYMMAATGSQILAAPFAILGSVGVMVMMPNFNRLLKKHDIDYLELTAGEYKSTLSPMGEVTEKGRNKSLEDLQISHDLFKQFVSEHRPQLDIDQIATGEVWHGLRAVENKLVDELKTSDQYILEQSKEAKVYKLHYEASKSVREKLAGALSQTVENTVIRLWNHLEARRQAR